MEKGEQKKKGTEDRKKKRSCLRVLTLQIKVTNVPRHYFLVEIVQALAALMRCPLGHPGVAEWWVVVHTGSELRKKAFKLSAEGVF